VRMGLRNHWGYNTLGFFCLEPRYASADARDGRAQRDEFRTMVRSLHAAGIEVILDVVFNHTAETDEFGPTLCWRGLDNASWYRLAGGDARRYQNHSGCGNTLDIGHPRVMQMVMDSLRFWVQEMHVDGFRFDLATVLGRGRQGFEREAAFFGCVAQDPVLAGVKLIAEPWDIGPEGYRLGQFPAGWAEWNDRFRDTARAFWLGHPSNRGEFARRLCASSDVFHQRGRAPSASINYVVSHDGFTLRDLLSYEQRHNLANGEDNRDGHGHNLGWNCGIEGPSDEPGVTALRSRLQRTLLAVVLLAQGTPMLAAGDELGHTQGGNNNPYCQDNPTTWIDWARADDALIDFCAALIRLRRELLPLGEHWYADSPDAEGRTPLQWLQPDGTPLQGEYWHREDQRAFSLLIGQPGRSADALLLLANADTAQAAFTLPAGRWRRLLDSSAARGEGEAATIEGTATAAAHSLLLLAEEH
jgi:glycogen debranching enzyme GlgX